MRCISEAYQDGNETYTSIRERMQRNFRAFERIDFSQFNPKSPDLYLVIDSPQEFNAAVR